LLIKIKKYRHILRLGVFCFAAFILQGQKLGHWLEKSVSAPVTLAISKALGKRPTLSQKLKIYALGDFSIGHMGRTSMTIDEWRYLLTGIDKQKPRIIIIDKVFRAVGGIAGPEFIKLLKSLDTPVAVGAFYNRQKITGAETLDLNRPEFYRSTYTAEEANIGSGIENPYVYGPHRSVISGFDFIGHIKFLPLYVQLFLPLAGERILPHLSLAGFEAKIDSEHLRIGDAKVRLSEGLLFINFTNIDELNKRIKPIYSLLYRSKKKQLIDPDLKADDTVLIAPTLHTGGADFFETPIGRIPGSYLVASLINNHLEKDWIVKFPFNGFMAVMFAILGWIIGRNSRLEYWSIILLGNSLGVFLLGTIGFIYFSVASRWFCFLICFTSSFLIEALLRSRNQERLLIEKKAKEESKAETSRIAQESLLPEFGHIAEIDICLSYKSADSTGGDWYGVYKNKKNNRVFIFIGDVGGHGIEAALITGAIAGTIRTSIDNVNSKQLDDAGCLEEIAEATDLIVKDTGAKFGRHMTMVYLCYRPGENTLTYANRGHCPIMIANGNSKFKSILSPTGPLGIDTKSMPVKSIPLSKNWILFLYTDGLVENTGKDGRMIRYPRLKKALETGTTILEKKMAIDLLVSDIIGQHPVEDDCTYMFITNS